MKQIRNLKMKDLCWDEPEEIPFEYFASCPRCAKFNLWIERNIIEVFTDDTFQSPAWDAWSRLRTDIANHHFKKLELGIKSYMSDLKESESPEYFIKLKKIKDQLEFDLTINRFENYDYRYNSESRKEDSNLELSHFTQINWFGSKYVIFANALTNHIIPKIQRLLENDEEGLPDQGLLTGSKEKNQFAMDIKCKHYYLAIMLDYAAIDDPLLNRKRIEGIASKRTGDAKGLKGTTIARLSSKYHSSRLKDQIYLEDNFGENWKEVVLHLTEFPDALSKYLKENYT